MGVFKNLYLERQDACEDAWQNFQNMYWGDLEQIPRFRINNMNEAEFMRHIAAYMFNRGIEFAEKRRNES